MPWYKAGTVSVAQNSNAVIGTGTAFIANGRVGDAFRGPDGGWYEVTNIASDTALSISPNYQGAANAAGAYALAPMQGYVKDSADALRALVNQFGQQLADLTSTDGLPEGQTNKYYTRERAMGQVLEGLNVADITPILSSDSVLVAFGKLQGQVATKLPSAGGKLTGALNMAGPVSLASAATVAIGAAATNTISVTGTTSILVFDSIAAGARRAVVFSGALTLTHNATSLILPGAANITTAANDSAEFISLGSGNWLCLSYKRANGKSVAGTAWGDISGPLSSQTDLQAALNTKQVLPTSGLVQVLNIVAGTATVLPAGGAWAYWFHVFQASTGLAYGPINAASGVAAGGTTLRPALTDNFLLGFCWRVS